MPAPACEEVKTFANWFAPRAQENERFSDRFLLSGAGSHGFSFCDETKENIGLSLDMENKIKE
jgi:4-diphosphocytidyl-2C-methyl-D-erythritol kinase